MIDIPPALSWPAFQSRIRRGTVLRTHVVLEDEDHIKRLIILNQNCDRDDLYFIFTYGSVEFFKKNGHREFIKLNTLFFRPGETSLNPSEEMAIDCRRVLPISKSGLYKNWRNKELDWLPDLSPEILVKVDEILIRSKLISPKIKKIILPA